MIEFSTQKFNGPSNLAVYKLKRTWAKDIEICESYIRSYMHSLSHRMNSRVNTQPRAYIPCCMSSKSLKPWDFLNVLCRGGGGGNPLFGNGTFLESPWLSLGGLWKPGACCSRCAWVVFDSRVLFAFSKACTKDSLIFPKIHCKSFRYRNSASSFRFRSAFKKKHSEDQPWNHGHFREKAKYTNKWKDTDRTQLPRWMC